MTKLNTYGLRIGPALFLLAVLITRVPVIITAAREDDWIVIDTASQRANLAMLAGYGEEKLSSVLVTGSVLCDPCKGFNGESVSGAKVIIGCRRGRKTVRTEGLTDEWGGFTIELPSEIHAWPMLEASCKVRVLQMPQINSSCYPGYHIGPTSMRELSNSNGFRVYDVGIVWIRNLAGCNF
ncbi:hypothetical protein EJ110_NYTH27330 [Nymphaea thermarum]|nr:hypothetical protein EJ110_NYTH27330 [Nymphaea thermarum]